MDPLQDAFMPLPWAREVVRKIKQRWQAEPAQRRKAVELQGMGLSEDAVHRTMSSNFRVAMYCKFGGVPWLTWYLCIGDIPATLVGIVNAYIEG